MDINIRLSRSLNAQACREASRLCRGWEAKDFLMCDLGPQLYLWGQAERKSVSHLVEKRGKAEQAKTHRIPMAWCGSSCAGKNEELC